MCGTVQCPWHGSQFDVRTGEVKAGPSVQAIRTYAVTEDGGQVKLTVPGDEAWLSSKARPACRSAERHAGRAYYMKHTRRRPSRPTRP